MCETHHGCVKLHCQLAVKFWSVHLQPKYSERPSMHYTRCCGLFRLVVFVLKSIRSVVSEMAG